MASLSHIPRVARALGDPTRVRILAALTVRGLCVCELTAVLGVEQSVVSRHLGILRSAGLVTDTRDGRWVEYRIAQPDDGTFAAAALRGLGETFRADATARDLSARVANADRRVISPPVLLPRVAAGSGVPASGVSP